MFHKIKQLKVEMRERFALRKFTSVDPRADWQAALYCLTSPIIQEDIFSFYPAYQKVADGTILHPIYPNIENNAVLTLYCSHFL